MVVFLKESFFRCYCVCVWIYLRLCLWVSEKDESWMKWYKCGRGKRWERDKEECDADMIFLWPLGTFKFSWVPGRRQTWRINKAVIKFHNDIFNKHRHLFFNRARQMPEFFAHSTTILILKNCFSTAVRTWESRKKIWQQQNLCFRKNTHLATHSTFACIMELWNTFPKRFSQKSELASQQIKKYTSLCSCICLNTACIITIKYLLVMHEWVNVNLLHKKWVICVQSGCRGYQYN